MALDYCTECGAVEQGWREPTLPERHEHDIPDDDSETTVCSECGSVGSHRGIPEHDDLDMER